jgi:hypothetical protein
LLVFGGVVFGQVAGASFFPKSGTSAVRRCMARSLGWSTEDVEDVSSAPLLAAHSDARGFDGARSSAEAASVASVNVAK